MVTLLCCCCVIVAVVVAGCCVVHSVTRVWIFPLILSLPRDRPLSACPSFLQPKQKTEDKQHNKQQQIHRHKTKLFIMADKSTKGRQIPIVCPGHTRPLAELQYIHVKEENRTFLVSACHGTSPSVEVSALKWNVADNDRSESLSTTRSLTHSLSNLYS